MKANDNSSQLPQSDTQYEYILVSTSDKQFQMIMNALIDCAIAIEGMKVMKTTDIIECICLFHDSPWATYDKGKPITPYQLDSLLKKVGIKSRNIRFKDGINKVYYGKWFSRGHFLFWRS